MTTPVRIAPEYVQRLLNDTGNPGSSLMYLSQFWAVRAHIDACGNIGGLSDAERVVHLVLGYTGEVGNGGHLQYLLNPGGAFAHETMDALDALGATKAKSALAGVIALFPDSRVPKDGEARKVTVGALSEQSLRSLDDADRFVWDNDLDGLALAYLRDRPAEVLAVEQG